MNIMKNSFVTNFSSSLGKLRTAYRSMVNHAAIPARRTPPIKLVRRPIVFFSILLFTPLERTHTILLLPFWIVLFKPFDLILLRPCGNHFRFMCFHFITYQSVSVILLDFQLNAFLLHIIVLIYS